MSAKASYENGNKYPYDAGVNNSVIDWAVKAARGVVDELTDRRGIKNGFQGVDDDIRAEIVNTLAEIIRIAATEGGLTPLAVDVANAFCKCVDPQWEIREECGICGKPPRH